MTALVALLTAAFIVPSARAADPPPSTTFAHWTYAPRNGAQTTVSATPGESTGTALKFVNLTAKAGNTYGQLTQTVVVQPSTSYHFSARVASDGVTTGGMQAILSPDWNARYNFPAGSYGWRTVTWSYTTAADQTSMVVRLLSQDITPGFRIDDLTMTADGSTTNLVQNGDFETYTSMLGLTNSSLLFDPGTATLDVITNAPGATGVDWTVRDAQGAQIRTGSTELVSGRGTVDLSTLPKGFFTVDLSTTGGSTPATLHTSLGVLEKLPAAASSPDSPFGVGIHGWDAPLIAALARIGYTHARTDASWSSVELQQGSYDWSRYDAGFSALAAAGIEVLPISDYRNKYYDDNLTPSSPEGLAAYGRYTAALNTHFANLTSAVEIYNEFNIGFNNGLCGRTPECYVQLLRAASTATRAANPNSVIVAPGIAGASEDYIRQVLALGGKDLLDVVSIHPYKHPLAPEGMDTQMASLDQVITDTAGRTIPLWLTEYGWPTHTAGKTTDAMQADYLTRAAVLALVGGADRLYWYDARDDGTDPDDRESNFGLFEHPRTSVVKAAEPKAGAIAQAVMATQLAGRTVGTRDALSANVYSIPFGNGSDTTRVMWVPSGAATVRLATAESVTVTDQYGTATTLVPSGGGVTVSLSEHPIYVHANATAVTVVADPAVSLTAPASVAEGEKLPVTAKLDRTGANCDSTPAKVTVTVAGEDHTLQARSCSTVTTTIEVPVTEGQQFASVTGTVAVGRNPYGLLGTGSAEVTQPVQAQVEVELAPTAGSWSGTAVITIANRSSTTPHTLAGLSWSMAGTSGTIGDTTTLAPGATVQHELALDSLDVWQYARLEVTANFADRGPITVDQSVGIGPIEPAGQSTVPPINLSTQTAWHKLTADWGGADDLGGTLEVSRTDRGLRIHAVVTDDQHVQKNRGAEIWNGDSLQFAFSPAAPGGSREYTEIGLALTPSGPEAWSWAVFGVAIAGTVPTEGFTVTRDGTTTTYDVVLPWASIGFSEPPTGTWSMSMLVNEDDGAGRAGWLEWASGIGASKDTAQHFPVQLVP